MSFSSTNGGEPFWRTKTLDEMTDAEWESLCDGCAKCCLLKLEDEDTGEYAFTDVACRLLDLGKCTCTDYPNRSRRIPDCVKVTPELARTAKWLPSTCAYRLLAEGGDLYWWHPLVSGDRNSVHTSGMSVRDRVIHESRRIDPEDRIVTWPQ
ncbi:MAG: YcgN family cysteine cluster protein [Rhodospirillaceae bacterium]